MISPKSRSLLPSLFLCLLTTSGTAALGAGVPQDEQRQNRGQDERGQGQPNQHDEIRPPVIYIMESGSRPGIVPGFMIGPPPASGLRPDIYKAFHTAASLRRMAVDVTIYPDQADYIIALDVSSPSWSPQTWTLLNARSGIVLWQESGLLLQNALHNALGVIGRLWSAQQKSAQTP